MGKKSIGRWILRPKNCDGAGKGSPFVAEELAFEKAGGHGRTVHLQKISVSAGLSS
jgi:hypothetical protein